MTTRRELLTAIPGFFVPTTASSETPQSRIDQLAGELATALAATSGGRWSWTIDTQGEFLIMTRSEPATPR